MTETQRPAVFAGVDWAQEKHDVCIVDPEGKVLAERAFDADAAGLAAMASWLVAHGGVDPERIWVSIEVPHGIVVETLLERRFVVHSINPRQLDRFRDRFTVAGTKDDRLDARVLADSLRTDARAFRRLDNDDPNVIELREWSRMTNELSREDNALCNRMRQQLLRYFPQVLELTDDPAEAWFLALLEVASTPAEARRRRRSTIQEILRKHRIRRWTAEQVLEILQKPAVTVAPGTVEAATGHLRQLMARVRLVRAQRAESLKMLRTIGERMDAQCQASGEGREPELSDRQILLSLPGIGEIVGPTLLAEASRPLRARDYQAMRTLAGIAPVTRRSGKRWTGPGVVRMRYACNRALRNAMYNWGRLAAQKEDFWKGEYAAARDRGQPHGRACRGLADRLLRVAIAMLKNRTLYVPKPRREAPVECAA